MVHWIVAKIRLRLGFKLSNRMSEELIKKKHDSACVWYTQFYSWNYTEHHKIVKPGFFATSIIKVHGTVYMFTNELRCPTLYAVSTVEHEVQLKVLSNYYKYMYVPVCILISTYQNLPTVK